jgi:hypothetical protein
MNIRKDKIGQLKITFQIQVLKMFFSLLNKL